MDNGVDWMPFEKVREGDLREVQGLFDDQCFKPMEEESIPENAWRIGSRFVRRIKNEQVKSRLVLQDFAKGKPIRDGGLFAATPAQA